MSGHAYLRAIRDHVLAQAALAASIVDSIAFYTELKSGLKEILYDCNRTVVQFASEGEIVEELKIEKRLQKFKQQGPTTKLWIQYFDMVTIIKQFIESERSGNWDLQLQTIYRMLPYFHASGHYSCAKCCHLYLQDMNNLKKKSLRMN